MSNNRAWMPLHIDTYLADTGYLTAAEHGAYMLLIMTYWRDGGLPDDERLIARIARMSKEEWAESRDVLASFFKDGWRHSRIDEELAKADEIIEKRRSAALGRHAKSKADARAHQMQSKSTDTGVPPRTNNQDIKEEPNGSSKNRRGCRLPPDFVPDIEFAVSLGLTPSQAEDQAIRFKEWWPAQPGQKGVKLDWPLTWQTWCRKALERIPRQQAPSPRTMNAEPRNISEASRAALAHFLEQENGTEHDPYGSGSGQNVRYLAASGR